MVDDDTQTRPDNAPRHRTQADGSKRTFRRSQSMAVGAQVTVDGNTLSVTQKNPPGR